MVKKCLNSGVFEIALKQTRPNNPGFELSHYVHLIGHIFILLHILCILFFSSVGIMVTIPKGNIIKNIGLC